MAQDKPVILVKVSFTRVPFHKFMFKTREASLYIERRPLRMLNM